MPVRRPSRTTLALVALALAGCAVGAPGAPAPGKSAKPVGVNATAKPGTATPTPAPAGTPAPPIDQRPPTELPTGLVPVPVTTAEPGKPTPGPGLGTPRPALLASLSGVVKAPPGVVSDNGGGVLANNGGNVVANNGGSVISNNGGSLVGMNGSAYRLAATDQAPLAGARVYLLDAAGRPVKAPGGGLVFAVTDAQGRYAFSGDLPTHNMLLAVELADGKGLWQAIMPKDAPSPRVVDMDVVSTLATTYILDRYVARQDDPQVTLDRLPAAAEADTRARAAAALDKGGAALPARYVPETAVPLVEALRQADKAFDDQMEAVRKLLLVAGASDLGAGRPALEVTLTYLDGLYPAPGGGLYIRASGDRRIWRLTPDGKLETAAGKGSAVAGDLDGVAGADAGLAYLGRGVLDGAGRLVFADMPEHDFDVPWDKRFPGRLLRLGADGKLAQFPEPLDFVLPGEGDEVLGVRPSGQGGAGRWIAMAPGKPVRELRAATGDEAAIMTFHEGVGRAPTGQVYVLARDPRTTQTGERSGLYAFDPATQAFTLTWGGQGTPYQSGFDRWLDPYGNLFLCAMGGQVRVRKPDGSEAPLAGATGERHWPLFGAVLLPDGTAYMVGDRQAVYRIANGVATRVAGQDGTVAAGDASDLGVTPNGLAVMPDGALYVSDGEQILHVDAQGKLGPYEGKVEATGQKPRTAYQLARDGMGGLYVASAPHVYRFDAQGRGQVVFSFGEYANMAIRDIQVAADGTLYVHGLDFAGDGMTSFVDRRAPDGKVTRLPLPPSTPYILGLDPAGTLHVIEYYTTTHHRLKADDTLETLGKVDKAGEGPIVVDAAGRLYLPDHSANTVVRVDPDGTRTIIAGKGSDVLGGSGVDDGLSRPGLLAWGPNGDLYVADTAHRQIKRIPKAKL